MRLALTVFSALTTRVAGKRRWICSANESVLDTSSEGGMPREKSSGLLTSISTLPARCSSPAASRAAIEPAPLVALTTSSAPAAASANPARSMSGWCVRHSGNGGLPKVSSSLRADAVATSRVPTVTA